MEKFKSRKFLSGIILTIVGLANAWLESNGYPAIDGEKLLMAISPLLMWIAGEAYVDGTNRR